MDQSKYRALLPAPQQPRMPSPKKKRRLTRVACNNCRSRKLGCDGNRPCMPCQSNGLDCIYISKDSTETPQMVLRREIDSLRAERHDLREIVDVLSNSSEEVAQDALGRLRRSSNLQNILISIREASDEAGRGFANSADSAAVTLANDGFDFQLAAHNQQAQLLMAPAMAEDLGFSLANNWAGNTMNSNSLESYLQASGGYVPNGGSVSADAQSALTDVAFSGAEANSGGPSASHSNSGQQTRSRRHQDYPN